MWQEDLVTVLSDLVEDRIFPQVVPIGNALPALTYYLIDPDPVRCKAGAFDQTVFGLNILHSDYYEAHVLLGQIRERLQENKMMLQSARDGHDKSTDLVQIVCTVKKF